MGADRAEDVCAHVRVYFPRQNGLRVATGKGRQSLTLTSPDQFVGKAKSVGTGPDGKTVLFAGETTLVGQRVKVEPFP
jgi:hypothetical protein